MRSNRKKRELATSLETLEQLVSDVRNLTRKYHAQAIMLFQRVKEAEKNR